MTVSCSPPPRVLFLFTFVPNATHRLECGTLDCVLKYLHNDREGVFLSSFTRDSYSWSLSSVACVQVTHTTIKDEVLLQVRLVKSLAYQGRIC